MSRRRWTAALICAVAAALGTAGPASAAQRSICAKRATMRDSPRGFPIGYLYRPQRVRVIRYDTTRRWAAIRAPTGRFGWVATSSLCRKGR